MTQHTPDHNRPLTPGPHLPTHSALYPARVLLATGYDLTVLHSYGPNSPNPRPVWQLWAEQADHEKPWVYPQRATRNAAGFDLYGFPGPGQPGRPSAILDLANEGPNCHRTCRVDTNVRLVWLTPEGDSAADPQRRADIVDRSGLRGKGVTLGNPGIIDSDYTGSLVAGPFWLVKPGVFTLVTTTRTDGPPCAAVAQLLISAPERIVFASAWGERQQGNAGGFGSTDKPAAECPGEEEVIAWLES